MLWLILWKIDSKNYCKSAHYSRLSFLLQYGGRFITIWLKHDKVLDPYYKKAIVRIPFILTIVNCKLIKTIVLPILISGICSNLVSFEVKKQRNYHSIWSEHFQVSFKNIFKLFHPVVTRLLWRQNLGTVRVEYQLG